MKLVKVVIDRPLDRTFDYIVKDLSISIGQRVKIEFRNKKTIGIVVGFVENSRLAKKYVLACLDEKGIRWYNEVDLRFLKIISDITWVGWGEMLFAGLPAVLRVGSKLLFSIDEGLRISGNMFDIGLTPAANIEFFYGDGSAFHDFVFAKIRKLMNKRIFWIVDSKAKASSLAEHVNELVDYPVFVYYQGLKMNVLSKIISAINKGPCIIIGSRQLGFFPLIKNEVIFLEDAWMDVYRQEVTPKYDLTTVLKERIKFSGGKLFLNLMKEPDNNRSINIVDAKTHSILPAFIEEEFRESVKNGNSCGIFIVGSENSGYLKCNYCGSIQRCNRCDRPYLLIRKGDDVKETLLYCPSCGKELIWSGHCLVCSSISVKVFVRGVSKWVKLLQKRFYDLPIFINSMVVKKAGIYICRHWQSLSDVFSMGLLLGIDRVLSIDRFYSRELALNFVCSCLYKVERKLYVWTRFLEFKDISKIFKEEFELRKKIGLPPYGKLLSISIRSKVLDKSKSLAGFLVKNMQEILSQDLEENEYKLLGPYIPVRSKKRDFYYCKIDVILKGQLSSTTYYRLKELLLSLRKRSSCVVTVESY